MGFLDFATIKKAQETVLQRLDKIDTELSALRVQALALRGSRSSVRDVMAGVSEWVASEAARFDPEARRVLLECAIPNLHPERRGLMLSRLFGGDAGLGREQGAVTVPALCAMFGPAVVSYFGELVKTTSWPANALDATERDQQLSKIDARISELEAEAGSLQSEAEAAGLSVVVVPRR